MSEIEASAPAASTRTPWNKGKLTGAKPPLRPKHVWAIRTRLAVEGRIRDLAMFNISIDSKLRGCDVISLKVGGRCASRLRERPSDSSSAKDRTAGEIRADGADQASRG